MLFKNIKSNKNYIYKLLKINSKNNKLLNCNQNDKNLCPGECQNINLIEFLPISWYEIKDEFKKPYFIKLLSKLQNCNFFPRTEKILAFSYFFPLKKTKIVILGQDPFHQKGRADGLAFSSIKMSSSLRNINKEINKSYPNRTYCKSGDLTNWARQGVLLLNCILTVEEKKPLSHKNIGWEIFTARIINEISKIKGVVFMLWGNSAKEMEKHIENGNLVLKSSHPSAKGVREEFGGCNHFKIANEYLVANGKAEIEW